jgi:hypothetical protein
MITILFSDGEIRTFGSWCRPAVIAAYCAKRNITAEIINAEF